MGWALDNLGAGRCREIAEELIARGGGRVTKREDSRGELIGLCPLHKETNPSFSFNWQKDLYNCSSGCGGGDLIKLFAEIEGLSNKNAFRAFKKRYGMSVHGGGGYRPAQRGSGGQKPAPVVLLSESALEGLPELPEAWLARLEAKRGWSREVLARLGIRFAPKGMRIGDNAQGGEVRLKEDRVAIPIRDEKGRLVNIRLYRPGGDAKGKVISWGHGYGFARLWPAEKSQVKGL